MPPSSAENEPGSSGAVGAEQWPQREGVADRVTVVAGSEKGDSISSSSMCGSSIHESAEADGTMNDAEVIEAMVNSLPTWAKIQRLHEDEVSPEQCSQAIKELDVMKWILINQIVMHSIPTQ